MNDLVKKTRGLNRLTEEILPTIPDGQENKTPLKTYLSLSEMLCDAVENWIDPSTLFIGLGYPPKELGDALSDLMAGKEVEKLPIVIMGKSSTSKEAAYAEMMLEWENIEPFMIWSLEELISEQKK